MLGIYQIGSNALSMHDEISLCVLCVPLRFYLSAYPSTLRCRRAHQFALPSFCVTETNWSSFCCAAPDAIATRARSMPSAIDVATSAA